MPVVGGVVGGAVVHWHGGGGVVWHGVGCIDGGIDGGVDGGVFGGMMVLEKEPPTHSALAKPTIARGDAADVDRHADRRVHVVTRQQGRGCRRCRVPPEFEPAMTVLLAAPPMQAALAKPTTAAAMPQTLTGALIGAFTVLPDSAEMTPALPLPPDPPDEPAMTVLLTAPPVQPEFATRRPPR